MKFDVDFGISPSISPAQFAGMKLKHYDIPTNLMKKVRDISLQPIATIDAEGLRLLLVQRLYLESIVPASICYLSHLPLSGGDLEEGALMRSLFQYVPSDYWNMHIEHLQKAKAVLSRSFEELRRKLSTTDDADTKSLLKEAYENFVQAEIAASSLDLTGPIND